VKLSDLRVEWPVIGIAGPTSDGAMSGNHGKDK
jgi:hypothetical protein